MTYSLDEQVMMDVDWFAIDRNGLIGHFTTNGYLLPRYIASAKENNEKLKSYFMQAPDIGRFHANPDLRQMHDIISEETYDAFIRSYYIMSMKGLFTFDKVVSEVDDDEYYYMTRPDKEMTLDQLPGNIASILSLIRIGADFSVDELIHVDAII